MNISWQAFLGAVGFGIILLTMIPYMIDVVRGRARPARAGRVMFLVLLILALAQQHSLGSGWAMATTFGDAVASALLFVLALRYGEGGFSKVDIVCYTLFMLSLDRHAGIPPYFAEKLRATQLERGIISLDLTNDPDWNLNTRVLRYETVSKARYIDPKIFRIEFESYVYDNCVALLNYEQEDVFGVEIYNASLAHQQKQLFDLIWKQAKIIR